MLATTKTPCLRITTARSHATASHPALICLCINREQLDSLASDLRTMRDNAVEPELYLWVTDSGEERLTLRFPGHSRDLLSGQTTSLDKFRAISLMSAFEESGAISIIVASDDEADPAQTFAFEARRLELYPPPH